MKTTITSTITLLFWTTPVLASEGIAVTNNPTVERAKILYMQRKPEISVLEEAAKTGDTESQFFFAETLREDAKYMTREAQRWYESAANQGDYYSMFRLATSSNEICKILKTCPNVKRLEWKNALLSSAKIAANKGNAEAMAILYNITGNLSWLQRSADAGYPPAQFLLAHRYREGNAFFWPGQREKEEIRLIKASAKQFYPRAMLEYSTILQHRGEYEEAWHWLREAASTGYAEAIMEYALTLKDGMPIGKNQDTIKAYGLLSLLLSLDGGGGLDDLAKFSLKGLSKNLSPRHISDATLFAKQWQNSHPPLSYFRVKLEF